MKKLINWIKTHIKQSIFIVVALWLLEKIGIIPLIISIVIFSVFRTQILGFFNNLIPMLESILQTV